MIEVIVGLVLLAIAGGLVFGVIVQGFAGVGGARAGGVSDAALARTADALSDDVAKAATEDSRTGAIRDDVRFADAVRRGVAAYKPAVGAGGMVDTNAAPVPADIDDVRRATPTEFQVIVDGRCITWRAAPGSIDGRATFDITRSISPGTNCGAASETRRFLSSSPSAPGFSAQPFSYRLVCNPAVCPGSGARANAPCRPWLVERGTVPANRLRWIVGIDARLVSLTTAGTAAAAGQAGMSQSIRSREVEAYREALGC